MRFLLTILTLSLLTACDCRKCEIKRETYTKNYIPTGGYTEENETENFDVRDCRGDYSTGQEEFVIYEQEREIHITESVICD